MLDIEGLTGKNPSFSGGSVNAKFIEMSSTSGGMSAVAVLDTDGDGIADRVYGGDQQGNMWAIEAGNNGSWASAYRQSGNPQPLFTAKVGDKPQPITAAPRVTRNPVMPRAGNEPNLLVVFGTGSYLYTNDPGSNDTQSVYGVWDSGSFDLDRDNLQLRTMKTTQVDG